MINDLKIKGTRSSNTVLRHLMIWLLITGILYLIMLFLTDVKIATEFILIIGLSAPLPVYLHFWIFELFYTRRRYVIYLIITISLVLAFGLAAEYVFSLVHQNPDDRISGIMMILFILVCSTGFRFYGRTLRQQYKMQETELRHLGTELALLKSQLNPHFLFNTLNNLYSLSLDKSDQVTDVILKLSSLMRYVLESSKTSTVRLEEEIEFISNYVSLESLRLPDGYNLNLQVIGVTENQIIAPMLLTSVVENCFKHGLIDDSEEAFISVNIQCHENKLHLQTENLKSLDPSDPNTGSNGMGIKNLQRRLELLYPARHKLELKEKGNYVTVNLEVEL